MDGERLHVGRVIYRPDRWLVQTLRNHVANVVQLVQLWHDENAFLYYTSNRADTRPYLIRAAEIHDMGKPRRFQLKYDHKKREWSYSFAGHRFDAREHPGDEFTPYVEALAHLHHEYSVNGITRHMAQLRLKKLGHLATCLPLDLYTLEMCDQIEATVASALLEDKDPTARVFMDFQFRPPDPGERVYRIDPFVFQGESMALQIEWAEIVPEAAMITAVQKAANKGDAYSERRQLGKWLAEQLQYATLQTQEVTVCPWITP